MTNTSITAILRSMIAAITVGLSQTSFAASLDVTTLPTEGSGPFQYNAFHLASGHHGMSGAVLAWFDLGNSGNGNWNTDSGAINLSVQLYTDSSLLNPAGTATATGNFNLNAFNGHDGGLLGTLTWDFSNAINSTLQNLATATISFIDVNYVTSSAGYNANSTAGNALTLWGAEGQYDANTGMFDTNTTTIGMDMVALFNTNISAVPVPAAMWLFGSGLLMLAGVTRRKSF